MFFTRSFFRLVEPKREPREYKQMRDRENDGGKIKIFAVSCPPPLSSSFTATALEADALHSTINPRLPDPGQVITV